MIVGKVLMLPPMINVWDAFPLHPQPHSGEALSSYLGRLMGLNGIDHRERMLSLCFPDTPWRGKIDYLDYGGVCLSTLASLTNCPEARLQTATFAPLLTRFRLSPQDSFGKMFLRSSLSPTRVFCPRCIVDHPWYNLVWHFKFVRGCIDHHCRLVDRCSRCHAAFPLLSSFREPGICSNCGFDHRDQVTTTLRMEDVRPLARYVHDLEYLLIPRSENEQELSATIYDAGFRLAARRKAVKLTHADISPFITDGLTAMLDVKAKVADDMRAIRTLYTFLEYTYFLGLTVRELFDPIDLTMLGEIVQGSEDINTLMNQALAKIDDELHKADGRTQRWKQPAEAALLQAVNDAKQVLEEQQQIVTIPRICEIAELPKELLTNNEDVRRYVMDAIVELRRRDGYKWRAQLVSKVVAAINNLRIKNVAISPTSVAEHLNCRRQDLVYFPETVSILRAATSICFPNQDG